MSTRQKTKEGKEQVDYSGLLLVDILNIDYKNFFTTYKTDIAGFSITIGIIILMILGLIILARIGA